MTVCDPWARISTSVEIWPSLSLRVSCVFFCSASPRAKIVRPCFPFFGADARGPDAKRVADRLDEVVVIDVDRDQELAREIGRANTLQGRAAQEAHAVVGVLLQPSLKCGVGLTTHVPAGGRGARGAGADGHRIEAGVPIVSGEGPERSGRRCGHVHAPPSRSASSQDPGEHGGISPHKYGPCVGSTTSTVMSQVTGDLDLVSASHGVRRGL